MTLTVMTAPARYPITCLIVCLSILLVTCSLSVWKLKIDSDPFTLLTYTSSPSKLKRDLMNNLFPQYQYMRAVTIMMSVNENNQNNVDIITKERILYFHKLILQVSELNATKMDGKNVFYEDICMRMDSSGCMSLNIMAFWDFNVDKLMKDSNIHRTLSIPKKLASGDLLSAESILGSVKWNPIKSTIVSAKSFKYYAILLSDQENDISMWEREFTIFMKKSIQEFEQEENNSMGMQSSSDISAAPGNVSLFFNCQYSLTEDITETFVSVGPMFLISFSITLVMVVTTLVLMRGEKSDSIILRILVGISSIILISMDIFSSFGIVHLIFGYNLNPLSAQALPLFLVGIGSDGLFILQTYFNRYRENLNEFTSNENDETIYEKFVKNSARYYREVISALIFTLIVMCFILIFVVLVMRHPITMAISVAWQTMVSVIFLFFTAIFGITPLLVLEFKFNTRKNKIIELPSGIPETTNNNGESIEEEMSNLGNVNSQTELNNEENEDPQLQFTQLEEMEQAVNKSADTELDSIPKYRVERIIYKIFDLFFDKPKYFLVHIFLILLALSGIIASIAIIATINEEPFTMTDLYAKSSQLTSFLHNYNVHYGDLEYPGYFVMYNKENSTTDMINFSSPSMATLLENVMEFPPSFMKSQINWFSYFKTWIYFMSPHMEEFRANRFKVPPQKFNTWMDEFTHHDLFSNLASFVVSKQMSKNVTATRIVFSNKNFLNSEVTAIIEKENTVFMKKLALDHPETGLNPSKNSFIVNDMDLIFESFVSDPFNVGVICTLAILSVALVSILVTSIFEIPIQKDGKLSLFINIVICSIITCFLTLITLIELVAGLRLLGIPINGLSIMNFSLQIGLFSEYLFQITKAFILTKSTKKTYSLLTVPLLICSLSTVVSIFPLAFHDIRIVKKYFFDIIILGQSILLFNVLVIFPAILSLIERFNQRERLLCCKK